MANRSLLISILFFLGTFCGFSQTIVSGSVYDKITGESLIGANVLYQEGKGAATDVNGYFEILIPEGTYSIEFSYVGYKNLLKTVVVNKDRIELNVELETTTLTEVEVVADIAIDRKTPVAFTNILPKKLERELASQDIPMLLNSTPGVFATQTGGGDGDARITLRGFNQRNVAVMIDGVPMNDMENGWVYWSNWFGLDVATRTIQVQRGLGASKLAIPSVGGTINIITKGVENRRNIKLKQEIGMDGFSRTTIGFNSGEINKGWGFSLATSIKSGDGWVDNTWTKGQFYYIKAEQKFNNHVFSISAFGAPQSHGQRSWKLPVATYDKEFAASLFNGSDNLYQDMATYNQAQINLENGNLSLIEFDSLTANLLVDSSSFHNLYSSSDFIDTNNIESFGIKYNQHWGYMEPYTLDTITDMNGVESYDTIRSISQIVNERENYYHKPQISIKDFWKINDRLYLSNVLYLSLGRGGGVRFSDSSPTLTTNRLIDFQNYYDLNTGIAFIGSPWGDLSIDPVFSNTLHKSSEYLYASVNNHLWYGYLSTLNFIQSSNISHNIGFDVRSYTGEHYREVYDLLGGDYLVDIENANQSSAMKIVGDTIGYHNDSKIYWAGSFYQLEYSSSRVSAFLNLSGSLSGYKRIDYFLNKDIVLSDTTISQAVGFGDTINYAGVLYHSSSPEVSHAESQWQKFPSYTFKSGLNYNLNEKSNVFLNLGYIVKAPKFKNVFFYDNSLAENIESERIKAVEMGYSFRSTKVSANINSYYTAWENKPVDNLIRIEVEDQSFYSNISGMNALHRGVEIDVAYKPHSKVILELISSFGDWRWNSANTVFFYDDNNNLLTDNEGNAINFDFDAKGVHVGDAAQTQVGTSITFKPTKDSYLKIRGLRFGRYYADMDPISLNGDNAGRESWQLPSYTLFDFFAGHNFYMGNTQLSLGFSLINLFDRVYISDAQNNDPYINPNYQDFDAKSAGVFFGLGRRVNLSLTLTL